MPNRKNQNPKNSVALLAIQNAQWDDDESLLAPLNTIRSETTLSKLPIHNLSKKGSVNIHIKKTNKNGALELRWITKFGQAGQPGPLAYKLDTLIINRRIDEQRHQLEKTIALGSLYQICQELGKGTSGKDMSDIKNALEQNAFVGIDALVRYEDKNGEKRTLEAKFTRYDVVMKGGELADGTKADCVYIILSDPYYKILTQSPARPLDYEYLKTLTPGAQRFYELLSYKVYRALMSHEPHARLIYSEYCVNAPQKRYTAQSKVMFQMDSLHKVHLESGYITSVSYRKTKDDQNNPDWELLYELGPRAIAFHKAFNRNYRKTSIDEGFSSSPLVPKISTSAATETAEALMILQYFHAQARQVENYQPVGQKELQQARGLLDRHGDIIAKQIIDFAVVSACKTNFQMQSLGAVLHYEQAALTAFNQKSQQESAYSQHEIELAGNLQDEIALRARAEAAFANLSEQQKKARIQTKITEMLPKTKAIQYWDDETLYTTAHAGVIQDLIKTLISGWVCVGWALLVSAATDAQAGRKHTNSNKPTLRAREGN